MLILHIGIPYLSNYVSFLSVRQVWIELVKKSECVIISRKITFLSKLKKKFAPAQTGHTEILKAVLESLDTP